MTPARAGLGLAPFGVLLLCGAGAAQTGEGLPRPPEAPQQGQIEAGKLSKVPRQTRFVPADYPKEAAEKGIEADVVLLLDINEKGQVDAASVAEPSAHPGSGFEEAAVIAAQQFEFEPAEVDGKPIAVQISYKYRFTLAPKAPSRPPPAAPSQPPPADSVKSGAPPPADSVKSGASRVANLKGVLRERGTRLPMSGAMVTVFRDLDGKPVGYEATSDAEGRFAFFDLEPGEWKVNVEPPGYFPFRTTEAISTGEGLDVRYYVERGEYNPYDVTITATRPRKEVSRTVLSAQEIDKVPGGAGDPLSVVQNFAGVARAPVNGLLVVRGSAPEDTRVFVEGVEVPLIYHFGGLRSVMPVGMLESIEFYPGNFSPMYGRATGGIVDVRIKKLQPKKVGGYADVSILDTGLYLEVPLGDKGGLALAGRRSYIDFIIDAAVPANAPVSFVTAPRYYDYQLLGNYRPTPRHDLRAFAFGSDDKLKLLFQNPADVSPDLTSNAFSASTEFQRGLLTWKYIPSASFENTVRFSGGHDVVSFRAGQLSFLFDLYSGQLRETARHTFGDRWALSYGADVLFGVADVFVRLPKPPKEGEPPGPPDLSSTLTSETKGNALVSPAGFIEGELKPLPGLLLLPGLRVDYFQRIAQTIAQPRLTARWEATPRFIPKGGVGLFVQEPGFDETDDKFGNPDLKAERALHYSIGAEWKVLPHLTLDATGFYKDLSKLVSRTDELVMEGDGGFRPLGYDNIGSGTVAGLELVARHEFAHNFTGWVAYTLSRALRKDFPAADPRRFDFDQTHILTVVGSYLLPRNWQVGGRFRLVSGNPITPITGSVWNASADRYDPIYGGVNTDRNPMFHQLDLRIDKRWVHQGWMINVYLDIQNVYNRANAEGLTYNFDFSEKSVQSGLPLIPIIGIRADL